jgi:surface-anchored protein
MKKQNISIGLMSAVMMMASHAATLTSGHVDAIGVGFDGTDFDLHSHAEDGAVVDGNPLAASVEYHPGDLTILVTTINARENDSAWAPIGVASGMNFYLTPFSDTAGLPYVGIGTEELVASEWTGNLVITLKNVSGPGIFSLFQLDGLNNPTIFMSSFDGVSDSDKYEIPAEAHRHFSWAFTQEGNYDLTFNVAGTHTSGAKSADATFKFSVVPEPSTGLLGLLGLVAFARRKR